MILTELGSVTAYRMNAPKWAIAHTNPMQRRKAHASSPGRAVVYSALETRTSFEGTISPHD